MILQKLLSAARARVDEAKKNRSFAKIRQMAEEMPQSADFLFEQAIASSELSFICEIKKASPSKGIIAEEFDYVSIAKEYEQAGADAVSVLTEPQYFLGSSEYLSVIAGIVSTPILRKDFLIDAYQIYESKVIGASAVLLIAAALEEKTLREFIEIAHGLGLSALVEAHTELEVQTALAVDARIIGVNNRDLKTFEIDLSNTARLRKFIPPECLFVSESGIKERQEVAALEEIGVDAVLIGESLMRAPNRREFLAALRGCSDG